MGGRDIRALFLQDPADSRLFRQKHFFFSDSVVEQKSGYTFKYQAQQDAKDRKDAYKCTSYARNMWS